MKKTGGGPGKHRREGKMTEKIYHADAYCRETTAAIIGKEFRDDRFFIRLDRTIFCPAGGGQPADAGTINGLPLLGLAGENDDIVHVLARIPARAKPACSSISLAVTTTCSSIPPSTCSRRSC